MKRAQALLTLSKEHHRALVVANRCKNAQGKSIELNQQLWQQLEQFAVEDLLPHFLIEDQVLIPALERLGELTLLQRLTDEHELLKALLADQQLPLDQRLHQIGTLLSAHVRFEERELFEQIQDRLSANEQQQLENYRA